MNIIEALKNEALCIENGSRWLAWNGSKWVVREQASYAQKRKTICVTDDESVAIKHLLEDGKHSTEDGL